MSRVRITISIAEELAEEIDRQVDGTHVRNRSHAIETMLAEHLHMSTVKAAVILAGGDKATKKVPAIIDSIKSLHAYGITNITIAVGYLGKEIEAQIAKNYPGEDIDYVQSSNGTGGAINELRGKLKKPFLVINVQEPTKVNWESLIHFHNQHRPVATIATKSLRDLNGVYLFEPTIFDYIPKGFSSLEDDVFVKLTKEGKLLSYPVLT